jgi:predicted nucleotidyltransferase
MDRDRALDLIQRHEAELRQLGVVSLSLFGSTARGERRHHSDVDVAIRLEEIASGFETFGRLDRVRDRLAVILETEVDVIIEPTLPGPIKSAIERDRCRAF